MLFCGLVILLNLFNEKWVFIFILFYFNSSTYKTEHNFLILLQTTKKDKRGKTPKFSFNLYFRELKGNEIKMSWQNKTQTKQ